MKFHEWPLVVFTTLAIVGAGLLVTPLLAALSGEAPLSTASVLPYGVLLLGAGLAISLVHLGRPLRAPMAVLAIGRSRLSTEVLAGELAVVLGGAAALLPDPPTALTSTAAVAALTFLVALGLVYSLKGQVAWRGAVVAVPVTTAVGIGVLVWAAIAAPASTTARWLPAVILLADLTLVLFRRGRLAHLPEPFAPLYPRWFAVRTWLLAVRVLLVDVVPCTLVLASAPLPAAVVLAVGILMDRLAFYGLAAQTTTESAVALAEQALDEA